MAEGPKCRHCGRTGSGYRREPEGYVEWFDFAASMTKRGYTQEPCPSCGRWTLWTKSRVASPAVPLRERRT